MAKLNDIELHSGKFTVSAAGLISLVGATFSLDAGSKSALKAALAFGLADVSDLQAALDGKAASGHGHAITDVSGLQAALDGKAAFGHTHAIPKLDALDQPDDTTTRNADIFRHGLLPKLSGVPTQFLNGLGDWATPAGGGGGTDPGVLFVQTDGNDTTGDGTKSAPFLTVQKALDALSAVDRGVIVVGVGTFYGGTIPYSLNVLTIFGAGIYHSTVQVLRKVTGNVRIYSDKTVHLETVSTTTDAFVDPGAEGSPGAGGANAYDIEITDAWVGTVLANGQRGQTGGPPSGGTASGNAGGTGGTGGTITLTDCALTVEAHASGGDGGDGSTGGSDGSYGQPGGDAGSGGSSGNIYLSGCRWGAIYAAPGNPGNSGGGGNGSEGSGSQGGSGYQGADNSVLEIKHSFGNQVVGASIYLRNSSTATLTATTGSFFYLGRADSLVGSVSYVAGAVIENVFYANTYP